jgi:hypothetical protein
MPSPNPSLGKVFCQNINVIQSSTKVVASFSKMDHSVTLNKVTEINALAMI